MTGFLWRNQSGVPKFLLGVINNDGPLKRGWADSRVYTAQLHTSKEVRFSFLLVFPLPVVWVFKRQRPLSFFKFCIAAEVGLFNCCSCSQADKTLLAPLVRVFANGDFRFSILNFRPRNIARHLVVVNWGTEQLCIKSFRVYSHSGMWDLVGAHY